MRTKDRVYQAVVRSILLDFVGGLNSNRRILRVRRRGCVPSMELRRRLCLTSIPALLMQRRLRWFGHAARRPEGELIKTFSFPHRLARGADELEAS